MTDQDRRVEQSLKGLLDFAKDLVRENEELRQTAMEAENQKKRSMIDMLERALYEQYPETKEG